MTIMWRLMLCCGTGAAISFLVELFSFVFGFDRGVKFAAVIALACMSVVVIIGIVYIFNEEW